MGAGNAVRGTQANTGTSVYHLRVAVNCIEACKQEQEQHKGDELGVEDLRHGPSTVLK